MLMLERSVRIREVKGSNPSRSTKEEKSEPFSNRRRDRIFCFLRGAESRRCPLPEAVLEDWESQTVRGLDPDDKKKGAPRKVRLV